MYHIYNVKLKIKLATGFDQVSMYVSLPWLVKKAKRPEDQNGQRHTQLVDGGDTESTHGIHISDIL
jgi:hypothetical protein